VYQADRKLTSRATTETTELNSTSAQYDLPETPGTDSGEASSSGPGWVTRAGRDHRRGSGLLVLWAVLNWVAKT
jgi:hypothetical protein